MSEQCPTCNARLTIDDGDNKHFECGATYNRTFKKFVNACGNAPELLKQLRQDLFVALDFLKERKLEDGSFCFCAEVEKGSWGYAHQEYCEKSRALLGRSF